VADPPHSGDGKAPDSRPDDDAHRAEAPHQSDAKPDAVQNDAPRADAPQRDHRDVVEGHGLAPLPSALNVAAPVPKLHSNAQQADAHHGEPSPAGSHDASPAHGDLEEAIMPEKSDFYPADNPAATKHIDVLQGIINRLANNSSSCKTWCLTLISALLSLAGATKVPELAFLAIVPLLVFRYLDSRYLAQERAYRRKYNEIVKLIQDGDYLRGHVFSAGAAWTPADLNDALKSWSVRPLYCTLIGFYGLYVIGYLLVWLIAYLLDSKFGWFGYFNPSPPPPPHAIR
jgi:hypothetical protein